LVPQGVVLHLQVIQLQLLRKGNGVVSEDWISKHKEPAYHSFQQLWRDLGGIQLFLSEHAGADDEMAHELFNQRIVLLLHGNVTLRLAEGGVQCSEHLQELLVKLSWLFYVIAVVKLELNHSHKLI
jgi:succinate-acetate transporter protein